MSDQRRILDRESNASPLLKDLVVSARDDAPPADAKARARTRLDRSLGEEGVTTHVSALSAAMAEKLTAPLLTAVPLPTAAPSAPASPRATAPRTWLFASIAAASILAVGGVGIVSLLRNNNPPQQVVVQAPPPATPATTASAANTAASNAAPANGTVPAGGAAPPGQQVAANTATPGSATAGGSEPSGGTRERTGSSGGSRSTRERTGSSGATASAASSTAAAPSGGASGTGCAARCRGDIDCLLRCSTQSSPSGASHAAAAAPAGGPEAPSRNAVLSALNGVRGSVQACGHGMTGTASVAITFASSGRVTSANVAPPFAGTAAGSCIARAVRSASVPSFTRPSFTVNFPFVIR